MKKAFSILVAMTMIISTFCSCAKNKGEGNTANEDMQSAEQTGKMTAVLTSDKETTYTPVTEIPKSLKILAIGNSFSTDCMEYLWNILRDAGVGTVILGNLFYGGCDMSQHLDFARKSQRSYTYYKNTDGNWSSRAATAMDYALADEEWDIITLQESSRTSGLASSYEEYYSQLVDLVKKKNKTATLVWNMTWAYQSDSTHSSFPAYGNDQMKMFTMIADCVRDYVMKDDRVAYFIPAGTAVQNARTSFIGDHITVDGYHLNQFGRYLAALTWACRITGVSPYDIGYNPSGSSINDDMLAVARESVVDALAEPLAVTQNRH